MNSLHRICIFLFLHLACWLGAQNPVNGFANVSGIAGAVISVNNVSETYDTFEDGEYVIIMQMQDNVIGTNTTNASTFGNLGSIQSAGLFEVARILTHAEASGLPTTFTLTNTLSNTYNINANASVQLISFPNMGTNYTTSGSITTLAWNGTIGGVTAFSVGSVFTLAHNITASGCGFRGGSKNTPNGYSACDDATYVTALATRYAGKGEGIYKRTAAGLAAARGKLLNGGGGGNDVNAGGGGGSNFTAGGGGGSGWTSSGAGCSPIAGGVGGLALSGSINASRIFMGGGGGGGHENDNNGTAGVAGGGIILIKAGTFSTTSCAGVSISANGNTAANASNDGAGGGGGGGSILLNVSVYSIPGSCALTVSANGGNGGNSNAGSTGAHGGGGGGGQGVVIYSGAQPTTNVTTSTIPGAGGVSCSNCTTQNGSIGTGTSNSGIVTNGSGPLPVELLSFTGHLNEQGQVELQWRTAVERNSDAFLLERMGDEKGLFDLVEMKSKGNNSSYTYVDTKPVKGLNYYRLKERAKDGTVSDWNWISVDASVNDETVRIYPNPATAWGRVFVYSQQTTNFEVELIDPLSAVAKRLTIVETQGPVFVLDLGGVAAGTYVAKISAGNKVYYRKLVVSEL